MSKLNLHGGVVMTIAISFLLDLNFGQRNLNGSEHFADRVKTSIINGYDAPSRPFFARVVVEHPGGTWKHCSGAIIDEYWVLSSCDCYTDNLSNIVVQVNEHVRNEVFVGVIMLTKTVKHPSCSTNLDADSMPAYNLALFKMRVKTQATNVLPLCMERNSPCSILAGCGLGADKINPKKEEHLQEAVFVETTNSFFWRCPLQFVCAKGRRGDLSRLARRDTGAPLYRLYCGSIIPECLYGVASFHESFRDSYVERDLDMGINYYSSVPFFYDWIRRTMEKN